MIRTAALLSIVLALSGCQAGYYLHLAGGHTRLMNEREPVDRVLAEGELEIELARKLELTGEILDFADIELFLPVGRAYRRYVALDREWVVWNLMAAPEFSLEPFSWCYPIAGCNHYRGYFDIQRAKRDAELLRAQGYQVYGAGVVAYSTLGWFADPITTPMLAGDDAWIAELLFHELVHRRFWLRGDTAFNESLATAVAREGVRRWLVTREEAALVGEISRRERARREVLEMVGATREKLRELYARDLPETVMRDQRDAITDALRGRYQAALADNADLARYRRWFEGPLNNAQLNSFRDYNQWVPAFNRLLLECAGHWACFWERVEGLAAREPGERNRALNHLAGRDD